MRHLPDKPIINSPYAEPRIHWVLDDDGHIAKWRKLPEAKWNTTEATARLMV